MSKDFLNSGILGGGVGTAPKSGFRAIKTEYIGNPDYNPRFFETFPTVWASGYAFRKALEQGDEKAIEEWREWWRERDNRFKKRWKRKA